MTSDGRVIEEIRGREYWLTLASPRANALTIEMWAALGEGIRRFDISDELTTLVISGADRRFSAGADIEDLRAVGGPAEAERRIRLINEVLLGLYCTRKPVIAVVDGPAIGGAWGLALCCDIVLVSRDVVFRAPFLALGITLDSGLSALLPSVAGPHWAMGVLVSGRDVGASEALRLGLATEVFDQSCREEVIRRWCGHAADMDADVYSASRGLLRASGLGEDDLAAALEREMATLVKTWRLGS